MLEINQTDRIATLGLLERADVSTALAMHELMLRVDLEGIDSVEIDASAALKLDASVLQLLVAWFNLLDSHHIPWRWRGVSEAFSTVAAYAGLLPILRLADV